MKQLLTYLMVLAVVILVAGNASAKFQEGVYLKSAKIEIIAGSSGDPQRYVNALALLDSLAFYYGPMPEAFSLRYRILASYVDNEPNLEKKAVHIGKLAVYLDSTDWACASPTVKDKYKKDCKSIVGLADSLRVKYWREYFAAGVKQLNLLDTLNDQIKEAGSDSAVVEANSAAIKANADSAQTNFRLCITLDAKDERAYVAMGTVYEKQKMYVEANEWLTKGLQSSKDSAQILMSIAYNYVQGDKYPEAVPYFSEYLKLQPTDTSTMFNLTICFVRAKQFDSAASWYHKMLEISPKNFDALHGIGRFFNTKMTAANDSARMYQEKKDDAATKKWDGIKKQMLDSSYTYYKAATASDPTDKYAMEEYAVVTAIQGNYEEAGAAYKKLTELEPGNPTFWTSLGDCYLNIKKLDLATAAYEKVLELDSSNRPVMERLSDLYKVTNKMDKAAVLDKKLK
ncbi:MAG: tetratricopeptide repeat protein [Candidatus Zixiibacteriota bacterium]